MSLNKVPMEETVKERLTEFLKNQGISKKEFCDAIGVSKAYTTSIHKSISDDVKARILENYPLLNMDWLIYGKGEMLKDSEHYRAVPMVDQSSEIEALKAELKECKQQISSLIQIIANLSNEHKG